MARLLAPAAALLLLAACGDTLVDHRAGDLLNDASGCGYGQVICGGVCTTQTASVCGSSCAPCGAPANATAICTPTGAGGHAGTCGFECDPGLLRCGSGCCSPALVAAGGEFSCASSTEGDVHCFGAGTGGQLGDGAGADRALSAAVDPALTGSVTALSAGGAHACAVSSLGTLCWGTRAAFGLAGAAVALEPVNVPALAGATAISAGRTHTCAIVGSEVRCVGAVAAAGGGAKTAAGLGGTPLDVAAGDGFTCALVDEGAGARAVKCWGDDTYGQLGTGGGGAQPDPVAVASVASTVAHVTAGARHACAGAEARDGLTCWGDNASHQLGTFPTAILPATLSGRVTKPILALSAGDHATCAIEDDGAFALSCWSSDPLVSGGSLNAGEPNHVGPTVPLSGPRPTVSAGAAHTCYVDASAAPAKLRCFGAGARGRLGSGSTADSATPVPVLDR